MQSLNDENSSVRSFWSAIQHSNYMLSILFIRNSLAALFCACSQLKQLILGPVTNQFPKHIPIRVRTLKLSFITYYNICNKHASPNGKGANFVTNRSHPWFNLVVIRLFICFSSLQMTGQMGTTDCIPSAALQMLAKHWMMV